MPGHSGVLQMAGVLLAERTPPDGRILIVGAGGGLDTRALAQIGPKWRFVGVDPSANMLNLARTVIGDELIGRVELIHGSIEAVPTGKFDAATCILVLGLIPDDGGKRNLLLEVYSRLVPGAPFVLIDQCLDRFAPDFSLKLDRYAAYAHASGVDSQTVENAREQLRSNPGMVTAARNAALLAEVGFSTTEIFYVGMAWRGWIAYA